MLGDHHDQSHPTRPQWLAERVVNFLIGRGTGELNPNLSKSVRLTTHSEVIGMVSENGQGLVVDSASCHTDWRRANSPRAEINSSNVPCSVTRPSPMTMTRSAR